MNRTLLLEHADRFSDVLFSLLNWELENHYDPTPFPGVTGYYDYESEIESWKFHLTITGLNRRWKHFIEDVGLDENDTEFCVEHLLTDLKNQTLTKLTKRYEKYHDHPKLKKYIRPASTHFKEREIVTGSYGLYDTINEFENFFTAELEEIKKQKIRNEVLANHSINQNPTNESKNAHSIGLSWKKETEKKPQGYKTNLSELCYVLAQSGMIVKEGKPVTHKYLTSVFNELFDADINVNKPTDLIGKRSFDKTFIHELNEILKKYSDKEPQN
jgi:hypothetical protein